VIARMREFMRDATQPAASTPGVSRLDEVLESCLRNVSERHGATRVRQNIDPQLRNLRCHENVGRAIAHLVENGLQASAPDGPVHISANLADPQTIELVVTDSGPGIAPEVLKTAFDPGFTTRSHQGGNGVGLAVSRDMIEALNGEIELTPAPAGGTRATVRVPTLLIPEAPKPNLKEVEHATA
jgi:signal transduction histidine kinase